MDTPRDVAISFLFVGGVVLIKLLAFGRSSSLSRLVLNLLCRGSTYSGTASLALDSSAAVLTDSGAAAALALASSAAVLADACSAANDATVPHAIMLTDT